MMVIFSSQSEKKALRTTRRILDTFADRIGHDTWRTVITEEGLSTVKMLLRKQATKNTAVSCHWIRSRNKSELLWIVGNRDKFDEQGRVPVHATQKDFQHSEWENPWDYMPQLKAITALAALLHDWGKANDAFQKMLVSSKQKDQKDPYRHEWISCKLIMGLVDEAGGGEDDNAWLRRLQSWDFDEKTILQKLKQGKDTMNASLKGLPPFAAGICWLIMTHHRMPRLQKDLEKYKANERNSFSEMLSAVGSQWGYQKDTSGNVSFSQGLLKDSMIWAKQVKKWAGRLLETQNPVPSLALRPLLYYARLSLMMGDYYASSQKAQENWQGNNELYAKSGKDGQMGQKLDEHLVGVAAQALKILNRLPQFSGRMEAARDIRLLRKQSPKPFAWQDRAVEKIKAFRREHTSEMDVGWFIVNMASTGCGKTLANAKIMQAISEAGNSLRYILALGLRSLTLQTGTEYRTRIGLGKDELAVLIGDSAIKDLYEESQRAKQDMADMDWKEDLLDGDLQYWDTLQDDFLNIFFDESRPSSSKHKAFLFKPVLVATIDHIVPAVETIRGGKYMLPFLRLMSSDLVIDEVDDFDVKDLMAISRLVHLAGMLGRSVAISSATLPPDLVEGLFCAYQKGRACYGEFLQQKSRTICVWCDEFRTSVSEIQSSESVEAVQEYREWHKKYVDKRTKALETQIVKRKAYIVPIPEEYRALETVEERNAAYFGKMLEAAISLHRAHHMTDKASGKRVSFGLIRMANITPCVYLSLFLLQASCPSDCSLKVMTYHSRQTLLLRHEQEQYLDQVLNRKGVSQSVISITEPNLRRHIDGAASSDILFITVATPVEEVGRDHDFDWAVVEPSSYRSIIQLAGRILRHRILTQNIAVPNLAIMQYNLNGMTDRQVVFSRPGYETGERYPLESHDMKMLVDEPELSEKVDAVPRIQKPMVLEPKRRLIHLEHQVLQDFKDMSVVGPAHLHGYLDEYWWLTAIPQQLNPFREGNPEERIYLRYEDGSLRFCRKTEDGEFIPVEGLCQIVRGEDELTGEMRQRLWLQRDYIEALRKKAGDVGDSIEAEEKEMEWASKKYGSLSVREQYLKSDVKLHYSDVMGLWKDI